MRQCVALALSFFASAIVASAQTLPMPENLGLGLRQLAELSQSDPRGLQSRLFSAPAINSDGAGRVMVNINLDGKVMLTEVEAEVVALGGEITATDNHWRDGVISAWLPLSGAAKTANMPGVRSVSLARKPVRRVGVVTAESSVAERAADVNAPGVLTPQGILGRNISIGLVSDSFDTATTAPRASVGVASGDLPGAGNPDGYTQPVVVLKDDPSDTVDEGRAMAEIVHDIAPAAKISFSAAGATQASMAASIRNLRTSPQTLCDIIVDDIAFSDEPFFSDGAIARAIDDVATSNSLAGKKVAFFSAAGNSDNHGYMADANIISTAASAPYRGNLRLTSVPSSLYAGGFQNLNPTGTPSIIMNATTADDAATLILQWDDPFNTGGVTTDYNVLVFSTTGVYLGSASGTDNNFATSQPLEIVDLAPNTTYQLVISLASNSQPVARHLVMLSFGNGSVTGNYLTSNIITLFGHPAAANANAVAAYVYNNRPATVADYNPGQSNPPPGPYEPAIEGFTALGGNVPIYFTAQGQRLASPDLRKKPEFAAADGVDTSFFPQDADADYDNNGFPNFFGTSAAAPNAGAFAALLLEAAGGPASLTPAQIRTILRQSTFPHDLDPNNNRATLTANGRSIVLAADGDDSNDSATSPTFFTLSFDGPAGSALQQVIIDLTNPGLVFDPRADLGFPFTVGRNDNGVAVTSNLSADQRTLTLGFGNSFTPGKSISFGLDRDLAAINAGGNSADVLGGASVIATVDGQTHYGGFANQLGTGFVATDGDGLIDARKAVESLVGQKPVSSGIAANLSTRGEVGSEQENALIGGLIIQGTPNKKIILRALGPSVPLAGAMGDPTLELHNADGQPIAANDDWQDDSAQAAAIQASGFAPLDPHESALLESLGPANYTAIVRGAGGETGIALVEAYDLDDQPAGSRLANIATRGTVGTGDNVMIAGFFLQRGANEVVVRALGPTLSAFNVSATLPDPSLELRDSQGTLLGANDNWQESAFQAVQLTAAVLGPTSAVESALITTLNPGGYTAIVRGAHGTTGVALVEVYSLP